SAFSGSSRIPPPRRKIIIIGFSVILDSEWNDECIDFTMLCLVNWGGNFLNFPIVFKSTGKNQKKIKEKREFLSKTSFRPNRFFYMVVIQKLI
ncbi:Uncharacterized protein FWK35_00005924, partial [Aphis craccivora]